MTGTASAAESTLKKISQQPSPNGKWFDLAGLAIQVLADGVDAIEEVAAELKTQRLTRRT